ncbi:TetR/AcrR family transcriptional regulator [Granulosicoccus sp. 3-233]|uniref:TetR/AcrR family transcriptional regulator n=1 Tax=Granulosicoccus sp. 3-233 TaxID=3417969 RepID=UPI003D355367
MGTTTKRTAQRKPHHHGDLREALIQAGIELLAEHGAAGLTLRRCAARAGVSHAAPAHHFDGLEGLLTTIAARGFSLFTELMIKERQNSGGGPRKRLLAICRGYLAFAENNRSLYNLMFSSERLSYCDSELEAASAAAYQVLADGCAPFKHGPGGAAGTEIMIWSLLHGFAGLSQKARQSDDQHPMADIRLEDIIPQLELSATRGQPR